MTIRIFFFFLMLGLVSCAKKLTSEETSKKYKCECNAIADTLTFAKFSSIKDSNFVLVMAPIDSINQLIIDAEIQPFEKIFEDGKRQLWWHKGHPIKLNSASKWLSEDRIMQTTFYIFDNCNGTYEFQKFDTLTPKNLITHRLYFYENRKAKHLFVEAMTPNGRTHFYGIIDHNKYVQDAAISSLKNFKATITRYGFHYYN